MDDDTKPETVRLLATAKLSRYRGVKMEEGQQFDAMSKHARALIKTKLAVAAPPPEPKAKKPGKAEPTDTEVVAKRGAYKTRDMKAEG